MSPGITLELHWYRGIGPTVQRDLISSVNDRLNAQLSGDEIGQFADKLAIWGYPDLTLWTKRLAVMRKMRTAAGQPAALIDFLRAAYEPITWCLSLKSTNGTSVPGWWVRWKTSQVEGSRITQLRSATVCVLTTP